MTGISSLIAAELSAAAYPNGTAPTGWTALPAVSPDGGADSLTVFVNDATRQVVIAFKGSDNFGPYAKAPDPGSLQCTDLVVRRNRAGLAM